MTREYKLIGLRPGVFDSCEDPNSVIKDKNLLLLSAISTSGYSLERIVESLAPYNPKNLKIAVAFQKRPNSNNGGETTSTSVKVSNSATIYTGFLLP